MVFSDQDGSLCDFAHGHRRVPWPVQNAELGPSANGVPAPSMVSSNDVDLCPERIEGL